jgi:hypothetical protein
MGGATRYPSNRDAASTIGDRRVTRHAYIAFTQRLLRTCRVTHTTITIRWLSLNHLQFKVPLIRIKIGIAV